MLAPKSKKYTKSHYLSFLGKTTSQLVYGTYGIKAKTGSHLTAFQIEAARRVLSRILKKEGKLWIRIFPDMPQTSKPNEVRMGKGKGAFEGWYANVKADQILFEFTKLDEHIAKKLSHIVSSKLPIKTQLIKKHD